MTRCDLNLGFVGLGALGLPMAVNLQRAGVSLRVHTRSRGAETDPQLAGARPCDNPATEQRRTLTFCCCVSDDNAVHDVLFGRDGAAEQLQPGSIVIDCSTINPKEHNRPLPS